MASNSSNPLVVSVKRREPELVVPAKPTPRETKYLSDIDDQEGLRFHVPVIMFYKSNPSMEGRDPAKAIRDALAQTLVYYYPFAGRLIEGPNRKLMVDCNGEGVLFIEASADVMLEQLGDAILPRSPYLDDFLFDVPGSGGIIGCPLLLIQVTRFTCGGYSFAIRLNHTMSDAFGLAQFLNAIAEFARGSANAPSQLPVWKREILNARDPPRITCSHHEYEDNIVATMENLMDIDNDNMVHKSFFFGPKEMRAIKKHLQPQDGKCSTIEVLTACLWKCRTAALRLHASETVRLSCLFNARALNILPSGYYGNAFAYPIVASNAEALCKMPLGYVVKMVKEIKSHMSKEYIQSVADLMVIKGRPMYTKLWNFIISDNRRAGFDEVDFGWGKPIYGGVGSATFLISFLIPYKNNKGEDGFLVPLCLPEPAMERFQQELEKMSQEQATKIISSL